MKQVVTQSLIDLLTKIDGYKLSTDEQKKVARDKASYIMDKLMRKQFRRRVSNKTRASIAEKIVVSVEKGSPIHLTIPFGGYKHFWNSSQPETDWAELFHLRWMTEYVGPILAVYEPGVILEYISEDLILPRMNNYPEENLDSYFSSFHKLIDWYTQYVPSNLDIKFWRVGDKYDKKAIVSKVESLLPERKLAFDKLSVEDQESEIHRSMRSIYWGGKENLTNLSDAQKHDRIVESRLVELAFYDIESSSEFVGDYYWKDNHICICFSFGLSPDNDEFGDLTIQTAPGSIVDFWIGRGVIYTHSDKMRCTIISQQQYLSEGPNIDTVKVDLPGLSLVNYHQIEVLKTSQ